ncbi:fasciclin-like arabinogalactan protein 19 [Primulina tabacum]|uniref:fasciclin-like arabinogalactan protein 19 n=1 Tax=Primulina tabacum TaxID=48773 RepID=UPI003F59E7ED
MVISSPTPPFAAAVAAACLLSLLIIGTTADAATNNTFQELETTLQTLRNHGFTLFTNGITTSDIQLQLISTNSAAAAAAYPFTLFAPKDVHLFTLDMESSAASYISTLRYHVIPNRRLTFSDLLNHTSSFLETLLPQHSVLIGKTQDNGASGVVVDGIRLSEPDLFLGSRFVVHGIDGILVTGLIDNNFFNVNHKDSNLSLPSSRPLDPVSEYERNNVPVSPHPKFDWRIPAGRKRRGRNVRRHRRHKRHGRHDHI